MKIEIKFFNEESLEKELKEIIQRISLEHKNKKTFVNTNRKKSPLTKENRTNLVNQLSKLKKCQKSIDKINKNKLNNSNNDSIMRKILSLKNLEKKQLSFYLKIKKEFKLLNINNEFYNEISQKLKKIGLYLKKTQKKIKTLKENHEYDVRMEKLHRLLDTFKNNIKKNNNEYTILIYSKDKTKVEFHKIKDNEIIKKESLKARETLLINKKIYNTLNIVVSDKRHMLNQLMKGGIISEDFLRMNEMYGLTNMGKLANLPTNYEELNKQMSLRELSEITMKDPKNIIQKKMNCVDFLLANDFENIDNDMIKNKGIKSKPKIKRF